MTLTAHKEMSLAILLIELVKMASRVFLVALGFDIVVFDLLGQESVLLSL